MKIIGLTGAPGAGKDTAFTILKGELEPEWEVKRYSFADPLRQFADQLMDLPEGHGFWEQELKDLPLEEFNGHTPRELLIDLGMLGRKYWPGMWITKAIDKIIDEQPQVAVITDVRFGNEARDLIAMGATIVRIDRPGYPWDPARQSESGEAASYAHHRIVNSGSMPEFQREVESLWWSKLVEVGFERA